MKYLRWVKVVTRMDIITNERIKEVLTAEQANATNIRIELTEMVWTDERLKTKNEEYHKKQKKPNMREVQQRTQ